MLPLHQSPKGRDELSHSPFVVLTRILKKAGYPSLWRGPLRGTLTAWEWSCDASTVEGMLSRRCFGGDLANTAAPSAAGTWSLPIRPMSVVT